MKLTLTLTIILPILACTNDSRPKSAGSKIDTINVANPFYNTVKDIPPPIGFSRPTEDPGSFASWLSQIKLKANKTVYLYNGEPKENQSAQFAVLDITVGNKDLQQCADAVMRLRAEWLYSRARFNEIIFRDNSNREYLYKGGLNLEAFNKYLEQIFERCGTLSLSRQLHHISDLDKLAPGDVLIKGGSPGHAVIILDMAVSREGKKLYLIAQSYMPAQDIHILVNPDKSENSPWYDFKKNSIIETPEWIFTIDQLSTW